MDQTTSVDYRLINVVVGLILYGVIGLWRLYELGGYEISRLRAVVFALFIIAAWPLLRSIFQGRIANILIAACPLLMLGCLLRSSESVLSQAAGEVVFLSVPLIFVGIIDVRFPIYVVGCGGIVCTVVLHSLISGKDRLILHDNILGALSLFPIGAWYVLCLRHSD
jgi:hypothetical protein